MTSPITYSTKALQAHDADTPFSAMVTVLRASLPRRAGGRLDRALRRTSSAGTLSDTAVPSRAVCEQFAAVAGSDRIGLVGVARSQAPAAHGGEGMR